MLVLVLVMSDPLTVKRKGLGLVGERPASVNVLELGTTVEFKAISVGLKEHAPVEQERATVSVKFKALAAERETVKVVVVVPMGRNCEVVGELRVKLASEVPDKAILEEPLVVLSVTIRLPLRMPLAGALAGVNVIENWQLPPTAMVKG